jgi:hypothetical protein
MSNCSGAVLMRIPGGYRLPSPDLTQNRISKQKRRIKKTELTFGIKRAY